MHKFKYIKCINNNKIIIPTVHAVKKNKNKKIILYYII